MDATNTPLPQAEPHAGKARILVYIEQNILEQLRIDAAVGNIAAKEILRLRDYDSTFLDAEKQFKDLQELHNQALDAIKESTNENTHIRAALQQEQQRNGELHTINLALAARLSDAPSSRRQRMADPPKFNGDRGKLRNFKIQLRLKLAEEGSFPNESEKIRYIIGLLEDQAMDQIGPHLKEGGVTHFTTAEEVIQCLDRAFGDPDPKGTARAQLERLRMGNDDFSAYYAKFQRYCTVLEYNDEAILDRLDYGLNNEMKDALVHQEKPTGLHERIALYQAVDGRIRARRNEQKRNTDAPSARHNTTIPKPPKTTPHPTSSNSGYYGTAPMDLSSGRRRVSPEEKVRRIREGLCLYCGQAGHVASACPLAAKARTFLNSLQIRGGETPAPAPSSQYEQAPQESKNF